MSQSNLDATIKIQGNAITGDEVHNVTVEADINLPDMAAVVLSNKSTKWTEKLNLGDDIEISLGFAANASQTGVVFKGEVTGMEPLYDVKAGHRVVVRGLNSLHKLARGRKSVAYKDVTDKDIVDKICQNYSLSADYGDAPPTVQYDHVYQHNQSDLEFIRLRAARIGFEVLVEDTKLYFRKRTDKDSGLSLQLTTSGESQLEKFKPRVSTANQVSEVRVRAWDPVQKKEIIGTAKAQSSKLGDDDGTKVANTKHKDVLEMECDVPVFSKEQADNIAKGLLEERLMRFITGDGTCKGNPKMKPGIIVTLKADDKRFDGKYYITSVRHRYVLKGPDHGFHTDFKFQRDALGKT
jgi:uncharacterized protein